MNTLFPFFHNYQTPNFFHNSHKLLQAYWIINECDVAVNIIYAGKQSYSSFNIASSSTAVGKRNTTMRHFVQLNSVLSLSLTYK